MGPGKFLGWALFLFGLLVFFCEYLVYYLILIDCSWPALDPEKSEHGISPEEGEIRAMILADPHLLGPRRGHWFDKLRREWSMHRNFQTAMTLHKPDVVFFLGDIFDEGLWVSDFEFTTYVNRFNSLFEVPIGTKIYIVAGNHDIGFHYGITPYLHRRFSDEFDSPAVKLLTIKGNHFVLMNSMAMEGDGCFLCRPAEMQLANISRRLKCAKGHGTCTKDRSLKTYSRPIILQHFPLYRESDEDCHEPDEAPEDEKRIKFRERWECLSKESTDSLLEMLEPRLVFGGHTHHGCHRFHTPTNTHEYSVASFSWRNKDNPSFMLAVFKSDNYAISKCYMPRESTVCILYIFGLVFIIGLLVRMHCRLGRRNRFFKNKIP